MKNETANVGFFNDKISNLIGIIQYNELKDVNLTNLLPSNR